MSEKMLAVHFLGANMRSRNGTEKPWKIGETRTIKGKLKLCEHGYHFCLTWKCAFLGGYLYGPTACVVEVELGGPYDDYKGVSASRQLIKAVNVEREMRLFAAGEAAMALRAYEKCTGKKADERSWAAMRIGDVADRFAKRIGDAVGYWDEATQ